MSSGLLKESYWQFYEADKPEEIIIVYGALLHVVVGVKQIVLTSAAIWLCVTLYWKRRLLY
jgi:hypothetical protein